MSRIATSPGAASAEAIAPETERRGMAPAAQTGNLAPDPEWLTRRRAEAWAIQRATPFPSTRSEEWRYTDLARILPLDDLLPRGSGRPRVDGARGGAVHLPESVRCAIARDDDCAGRVIEMNGAVVSVELDPELASRGVVLDSLRRAAHTDPRVRAHLATEAVPATDGKFPALNAALWTDGVFLRVPRNVDIERPIRLNRWISRSGPATFSRILVLAEEHSRVSLVEEIQSPDLDRATLAHAAVELYARGGARVRYLSLQRLGHGAAWIANQRTLAEADSTLDTLNVALGGSFHRVDLNARLLGAGANSDMLGLYFGDEDQHFDFNTSQDHVAPHARSDLLYKGALDGAARGVFRGIIRVHEGAQRTDAYQTNRNLLLSEGAVATSLPNLEIGADDVRCSHGATVGQLDAEALFYLMSRGMSRERAERLVVTGFLGEVLGRLPFADVTGKVTREIETKLRATRTLRKTG